MMAITSNGVSQSKHLARHHIKITCTRLMHQRVGPALHHLSVRGLPTTIYPHTIRSVIINVQRSPTGELASHGHSRNGYYGTDNYSGNTKRYCASQYKIDSDPTVYGVNNTGNDEPHNNIQPFGCVRYFKRLS